MIDYSPDGSDRPVAELPAFGVCRRRGTVVSGVGAVVAAELATVDPQRVAQDSAAAVVTCRSHHGGHTFNAVETCAAPVPIDSERVIAICSAGDTYRHRKEPFLSKGFNFCQLTRRAYPGPLPAKPVLAEKFFASDQPLWLAGAASRWCPEEFGGMVDCSVKMAQLLRPKRRQLRATVRYVAAVQIRARPQWNAVCGDRRRQIAGPPDWWKQHAMRRRRADARGLILPTRVVGLGKACHVNFVAGEAFT